MKVFVFCIGGTGLRVTKSILMLAAAGERFSGYTIVPIIVDPHMGLEERKNLQALIDDYAKIRDIATGKTVNNSPNQNWDHGFFSAPIVTLDKLDNLANPTADQQAYNKTFSQFINLSNLATTDISNHLIHTLFSEKSLTSSLSEGFKGNPNVGTVVLGDQIGNASWFSSFQSVFGNGDRVFLISSVFGGTGAAGYPLIEKTIREDKAHPQIQRAVVGAVSVLPYFKLSDPVMSSSDIDSANYITKTKAALTYYERSVQSDFFYYIGEKNIAAHYDNSEERQEDKAHFIELVAATALVDFLKREKPTSRQYMSRAIRDDKPSMNLDSLGDGYRDIVKNVLDLSMLSRLVKDLPGENHFPLSQDCSLRFNKSFYIDADFKKLERYLDRFNTWLGELGTNSRSFAPLKNIDSDKHLGEIVDGRNLEAKDLSYYLLRMIAEGNRVKASDKPLRLRNFLDISYKAIDSYTSKLK